jgi:hypothetical protein
MRRKVCAIALTLTCVMVFVAACFTGTVFAVGLAKTPLLDSFVDRSPCVVKDVLAYDRSGPFTGYGCPVCLLRTVDGMVISVFCCSPVTTVLNCAVQWDEGVAVQVVIFEGNFSAFQNVARAFNEQARAAVAVSFAIVALPLAGIALGLFLLWRGSSEQRARRREREIEMETRQRMACKMVLLAAVLKQQSDACAIAALDVYVMRRIIELM